MPTRQGLGRKVVRDRRVEMVTGMEITARAPIKGADRHRETGTATETATATATAIPGRQIETTQPAAWRLEPLACRLAKGPRSTNLRSALASRMRPRALQLTS